MEFSIQPIGYIESPFKEKFGIPRQSGLANVTSSIVIIPPFNEKDAFRGLQDFSHLWLEFIFHQNIPQGWKPSVRPPRLGGNQKMGVFATRSSFRPNGIGLSVVELKNIHFEGSEIKIEVQGADLMNGTPIIDIKPYLPYVDCIADAKGGFAPTAPDQTLQVEWSPTAINKLETDLDGAQKKEVIEQVMGMDPRPPYKKSSDRVFGLKLYDWDIQWQVNGDVLTVLDLV